MRNPSRPRTLSPGDHVRVIAPSGPVPGASLDRGVAALEAWGLKVTIGEQVRAGGAAAYLAAGDHERAGDFTAAWTDPDVRAVICARGGYGAHRMIDHVDWAAVRSGRDPRDAPILVGYSDITALHEAVAAELGIPTLHGPLVSAEPFTTDAESRAALRAALVGDPLPIPAATARVIMAGEARGPLVGGNASVVAGGLGAPLARRSYAGALVVLEDIDEDTYRLDRIITQLRRSGLLDGAAGIVGATWVGCGGTDFVDQLLHDLLGDLGVPIVNGLPLGHGAPLYPVWFCLPMSLHAGPGGVVLA